MKKLLLILTFPCLLIASDKSSEQKDERSTTQKVASTAVETACYGNAVYRGVRLAAAIATGDLWTIGSEVAGTGVSILNTASATATAMEVINPKSAQSALDKAHEDSAKRAAINEERAGSRFRRCLSENAHCTDLNGRGIPKRCNSPARDFAMINDAETDRVIANYLKFTKGKGVL